MSGAAATPRNRRAPKCRVCLLPVKGHDGRAGANWCNNEPAEEGEDFKGAKKNIVEKLAKDAQDVEEDDKDKYAKVLLSNQGEDQRDKNSGKESDEINVVEETFDEAEAAIKYAETWKKKAAAKSEARFVMEVPHSSTPVRRAAGSSDDEENSSEMDNSMSAHFRYNPDNMKERHTTYNSHDSSSK